MRRPKLRGSHMLKDEQLLRGGASILTLFSAVLKSVLYPLNSTATSARVFRNTMKRNKKSVSSNTFPQDSDSMKINVKIHIKHLSALKKGLYKLKVWFCRPYSEQSFISIKRAATETFYCSLLQIPPTGEFKIFH